MVENQDEFDQKRFIAAMVLSGLILVVWQIFFAPPPPDPALTSGSDNGAVTQGDRDTTRGSTPDSNTSGDVPTQLKARPTATATPAVELEAVEHVMQTKDFRVKLSSAGARVIAVNVIQPEQYAAEGSLLKSFPKDSPNFPFGLSFANNSIALRRGLVWAFVPEESVATGETYSTITYRHTDPGGQYEVDKIYRLNTKNAYMIDLEVVVRNQLDKGVIADKLALDIIGHNDPTIERSMLDMMPNGLEGLCKLGDDLERELFESVTDPLSFDEDGVLWGGVNNRYFLFAAIPLEKADKCLMENVDTDYLRTRIVGGEFVVQPGAQTSIKYQLYAGPKDYDRLEEVGASLEEAVDFGILTFLCRPLRWALVLFYGWLGNWGLAIILLTLIIRILTWPINQKVYVNSEKMKEVQPLLTAIKEKHKDDQQRQAEETMKIWKEHGVSPLGCAPMLLQFPILLALYFMILNSVELYHANFALWYVDLSAPDPYFVLPILMGLVMVVQQKFMTIDASNPQMAQMATVMKIMPVMFTVFMLFLPAGVVLYYLVSLVLGLAQQYMIKRSYAAKAAAA